jgi:hypothetical protein
LSDFVWEVKFASKYTDVGFDFAGAQKSVFGLNHNKTQKSTRYRF